MDRRRVVRCLLCRRRPLSHRAVEPALPAIAFRDPRGRCGHHVSRFPSGMAGNGRHGHKPGGSGRDTHTDYLRGCTCTSLQRRALEAERAPMDRLRHARFSHREIAVRRLAARTPRLHGRFNLSVCLGSDSRSAHGAGGATGIVSPIFHPRPLSGRTLRTPF